MSYLNIVEIESAIDTLAQTYPVISERILLPHKTHEGRVTSALRIGNPMEVGTNDLLMIGGLHAREWVPPDALISLAADLLEAYTTGTGLIYDGVVFTKEQVRGIVDSVNIYLYPCANPDGRHYSQTKDPMWRKNRRLSDNGSNCCGVDLNRNFNFLWDHKTKFATGSQVSASNNPCDPNVYVGPAAESEPETRNVVWLLDTFPEISFHIDIHSAIPAVFYTWGSDNNQSAFPDQNFRNGQFDSVRGLPKDTNYGEYIPQDDLDLLKSMAAQMNTTIRKIRNVDYSVEQSYSLYPTSGASDDYAYSRHFADSRKKKIYAFTIECGSEFHPSWTEAKQVIKEVSVGLLSLTLQGLNQIPFVIR